MLGLARSSPAAAHVSRPSPQQAPGRPAVAARRSRHQRHGQRAARRAPVVAAAAAVNEGGDDASIAAAGEEEERGGAADGVQPPSGDSELEQETFDYLEHCQATYGRPGLIEFSQGYNGLPQVTLRHPAGAACELHLHGAAVTSWRHGDGRELLHLREGNTFDGEHPIDGGIQIAWPQYGVGPLPTNGFLQHLHWSVVDASWREPAEGQVPGAEDAHTIDDWRPTISLYADTDEDFAQQWPHKFEALYSVTLMQPDAPGPSDLEVMRQAAEEYQPWVQRQRQREAEAAAGPRGGAARPPFAAAADERPPLTPSVLRCLLQIHNCDDTPFTFTTGLRTHFATKDIPRHPLFVKTLGLRGKYVLDFTRDPLRPGLAVEDEHYVRFGDMQPQEKLFVDCEAEGQVLFCPGSQAHFNIGNAEGFTDVGISHPTAVAPEEARSFVCLSSARAVRKVTLQPGQTWVGEMVLTAHDRYWDLPPWELDEPDGVPLPDNVPDTAQPRRSPRLAASER